jgi:hypothetical protein
VIKRVLVILISLGLIQGVISLCFIEDAKGITKGEVVAKEGKDVRITPGGAKYLAQVASRVVRLTSESSKKGPLAPPCSVIGIKGKKITLKDFYGEEETVEVEEFADIKIGDKVVVKDGLMIIGISPQ